MTNISLAATNYLTSKRLQEAGIILPTSFYWCKWLPGEAELLHESIKTPELIEKVSAYTAEALMQIISLVEGTILAPELSAGNPVIFITCVLSDTTIRVGHAKLQKQMNGYPTPDTVCGYAFLRHVDVRTTSLAEAFASYILDVLLTLPTIRDTIMAIIPSHTKRI